MVVSTGATRIGCYAVQTSLRTFISVRPLMPPCVQRCSRFHCFTVGSSQSPESVAPQERTPTVQANLRLEPRMTEQKILTGSLQISEEQIIAVFFLFCRQLGGCQDVVETSLFQGAILFGDGTICAGPELPFSIGNAALGTCHHTSSMSKTLGSLGSCCMGWPLCSCCWASRSAAEGFISCRLRE